MATTKIVFIVGKVSPRNKDQDQQMAKELETDIFFIHKENPYSIWPD